MQKVTLYTREGCHLCEDAEEVLRLLREEIPFEMELVDITQDEDLYQKYKYEIPVVLINGVEVARYRIDKDQILHLLKSNQKRQKGEKR